MTKPHKSASVFATRTSGVLLHPTSLANDTFVGSLGPEAKHFINKLAYAKQRWWQVLPLNPLGECDSPYSTISSYAGEPLLISLEQLKIENLLQASTYAELKKAAKKSTATKVNFAKAKTYHYAALNVAVEKFLQSKVNLKKLNSFRKEQSHWIEDYALFCALKNAYKEAAWNQWPLDIRKRKPQAIKLASAKFAQEISRYCCVQYFFYKQLQELRDYAAKKNVGLVGDIPIFVSFDSVDVWANQELFEITASGQQKYVAGVPPDFFNRNGQRWGNALYSWPNHKKQKFRWWLQRFSHLCQYFGVIRIDHFIGFYRYWQIAATEPSAKKGKWRLALGDELFATAKRELGALPFIAEDLGLLTPEVTALRKKYEFPSMKVLQFGFGLDGKGEDHMPHSFVSDSVCYTGTHDNDTAQGWLAQAKREANNKNKSFDYAKMKMFFGAAEKEFHWAAIKDCMKSASCMSIFPAQDIIGLNTASRMNVPGTTAKNWVWRLKRGQITAAMWERLRDLCIATGRA